MAGLYEAEAEDFVDQEDFLGPLLQGVGGALGLNEGEDFSLDGELEGEDLLGADSPAAAGFLGQAEDFALDGETEDEDFLGPVLQGLGSALGLGEGEDFDLEADPEAEEFLPLLLPLAKLALPHLAKAAVPMIGKIFGRRRREFEGEDELEVDTSSALAVQPPAMAELVASMASTTPSVAESEAMVGAAAVLALTPRERRQLEHLVPQLVRAACLLARLLRRDPRTRSAIRVIPTVVKATAVPLTRPGVMGVRPVQPAAAGRVMQTQVATVLGRPRVTRAVVKRNSTATHRAARAVRRPQTAASR
jgi:hypothetical protein